MKDPFFCDDAFLQREYELLYSTIERRGRFSSADAQRHFDEGFGTRHQMIQSSRVFLRETVGTNRTAPLGPYEAIDCALHVNAYYLNLRGALDNLAWTLQYEHGVLNGVSEDEWKGRAKCCLFDDAFLIRLKGKRPELGSRLRAQSMWYRGLADLRDPAAHRIPIRVPGGVIASAEDLATFRRIEAEAARPASELGGKSRSEVLGEAHAVAVFKPIMIVSGSQGLIEYSISAQIGQDHEAYLDVAEAVVGSL